MSTNKRKDSAALFELIDKSTLKVPKATGQLKIPSWWSSKTNPPAAAPAEAEPDPTIKVTSRPVTNEPIPSALAARLAKRENSSLGSSSAPAAPATPPAKPAPAPIPDPQHRLFDPHAHPEASPSIRPPAAAPVAETLPDPVAQPTADASTPAIAESTVEPVAPVAETSTPPTVASVTPAPAAPMPHISIAPPVPAAPVTPAPAHPPTIAPIPENASAAPPPSAPRRLPTGVFAPQSVDRSTIARHTWMNNQRSSFARIPSWVVVAAASAGVILLILAIYLLSRSDTPTSGGSATANSGGSGVEKQQPVVPPPNNFQPPSLNALNGGPIKPPAENTNVGVQPNAGANVATNQPGKVYNPGEFKWNPDLLYLYIAASGSAEITKRNAEFLAQHGVSVGIEKNPKGLYQLIATEGFKAVATDGAKVGISPEMSKFRNQVVITVARDHPDYKRTKRDIWSDAMWGRVRVNR